MVSTSKTYHSSLSGGVSYFSCRSVRDRTSLRRKWTCTVTLSLLFFALQTDRTALDGIIVRVQSYFGVGDSTVALIRTLSLLSAAAAHLVLAVVGDSLDKKKVLLQTLFVWFAATITSALLPPTMFPIFVILRVLSSCEFAVLNVFGPVIVAEFFEGSARGRGLMMLFIGELAANIFTTSGSSALLSSSLPWQLSLFVSPLVVAASGFLLFFSLPPRRFHRPLNFNCGMVAHFGELATLKTYVFVVLALAFANFHITALGFWENTVLLYGYLSRGPEAFLGFSYTVVMTIAATVAISAMILGTLVNVNVAEAWAIGSFPCAPRPFPRAFPMVLLFSFVVSKILAVIAITLFVVNYPVSTIVHFVETFFIGGNSVLATQIALDVTPPDLRAAAVALKGLATMLIDSPSAQILGMIAEFYTTSPSPSGKFAAFLSSVYVVVGVSAVTSMIAMIGAGKFFPRDLERQKRQDEDEEMDDEWEPLISDVKAPPRYLEVIRQIRMASAPPLEDEEVAGIGEGAALSTNYIENPDNPVVEQLRLRPLSSITLRGRILPKEQCGESRFNIDLCCGLLVNGDHRDNVALHFNPRFDVSEGWFSGTPDRQIVINSLINNEWGREERYNNALVVGEPFTLQIRAFQNYYKIAVNGAHLCDFEHRMPLHMIRCILIQGCLKLDSVDIPLAD